MYIEQIYTGCLAEASYYIESEGEAAVIDPLRETEPYVRKAQERGSAIKYVFETHFHADFVSGHIDLARETGAKIIFGPTAETKYESYIANDNEEFKIGKLTIRTLHTPGHTPESTSFLLLDENGKAHAVFTGDTLFVGDVGRPDLLDGKMDSRELASMLYDSLNKKLKTLPDEVIVYPAHGPGSACGKNIGKEKQSTIGEQKKMNYAMQDMSREEFIDKVVAGLTAPPKYFFVDARINKEGYESIDSVLGRNVKGLSPAEVEKHQQTGALVLDGREADLYEQGHVPGSMNIGLNGAYAVWVGTLIDPEREIVVVAEPGKEEEAILRLARVGYENVSGFLDGGMEAWKQAGKEVSTVKSVDPEEFKQILADEHPQVLDIRNIGEWNAGHLEGAQHINLQELPERTNEVPRDKPVYVHCAGGYRSMIGSSILQQKGFDNIINIRKGMGGIKAAGVKVVEPVASN